ncbi:MAG: AsmA family protein [Burkholderiaceae bacterium]|nr:AsmA family protein [Burkholderiaceae bacterium]
MQPGRTRTITFSALGLLCALLLGGLLWLQMADWNRARPWLNEKLSLALQRPVAIRGELLLRWTLPAGTAQRRGWRDYLPQAHLEAYDLHLGNPPGMAAMGELASIERVLVELELLPLLQHRLSIPLLRFTRPQLQLVRQTDGRSNWQTPPARAAGAWTLELRSIEFSAARIELHDAVQQLDLIANLQTLDADPRYGIGWQLQGHWKQQPVSGSGKAGAVLGLQQQLQPYPLEGLLTVGGSRIAVLGTLTRPASLTSIDAQLTLSGPSMARLYGLTGVLLPETPAFTTSGHLHGELGAQASHWQYQRFTGKVGESDLAGSLDYRYGAQLPRPRLSGALHSSLLRLNDLAPLIGADSNRSKQARGVAAVQPDNKVLPVEAFHRVRWRALDAEVRYRADHITRDGDLPITQVNTLISLRDGVLQLAPLQFEIAGGRFQATLQLDGSGQHGPDAIAAQLQARASHLRLNQLFPRIDAMQATVGEVNADLTLQASGNSIASLLGSANGTLRSVVTQGSVSKLLLEEMGLNLGSVVLTKLVGDKPVQLHCMLGDFSVTQGLMQTRVWAADTNEARVDASGSVNLRNEQLNLTLRPQSKGVRIFSLRAPIYLRGSFKQPVVSIDKGVLALRAGGALALASVAPIAALLPLISNGSAEGNDCAALLGAERAVPRKVR